MKTFRVEALERFTVKTVYYVNAASPELAQEYCRDGRVAYHKSSVADDGGDWVETLDVRQVVEPGDDPEPV